MGHVLIPTIVILTITVPPLIMLYFANKILSENLPKEEKLYKGTKFLIACIVLAFLMYFPPMVLLGALDKTSDFVEKLTSVTSIRVFLFVGILISPLLLSIILTILSAIKLEIRVKEIEVKKSEVIKDISKFFALLLMPMFIWVSLILLLPKSITSKIWFVFILFVIYIAVLFALSPYLIFWLEKPKPIDESLKRELIEFCNSLGIEVRDIKVTGKKKYRIANAGVTGILPKYRYVFITEYLLENFDKEEIKAVLAHEIGHIRGRHLLINALLSIGWFAFWMGLVYGLHKLGIKLFDPPIVFFAVFFMAYFGYLFIVEAKIMLRNEFKADEFAAKVVGKETTIKALEKLSELNLTPKRTGKWFNILSFHPSIEERIDHLKEVDG